MKKIKILFVIDELNVGGTENQLVMLVNRLDREQFEPVVGVLKSHTNTNTFKLNCRCVTFGRKKLPVLRNIVLIKNIRSFLLKEGFDIVQTHFAESFLHTSIAVQLLKIRPTLLATRRNLYYWVKDLPIRAFFLKLTIGWADGVLVNSFKVKEACQKNEGVSLDKINVIQNAVEIQRFGQISKKAAKERLGLPADAFVVGVVANWRPIKGLDLFLNAAAEVQDQVPGIVFVLAGGGPQKKLLFDTADRLGIKDKTIFLENRPDIPEVMCAFDIAVQPSYSESFSNVLVEYMSTGLPVITSDVGDASYIIENGKAGILVKAGQYHQISKAIVELYQNKKTAEKFLIHAKTRVRENWASEKIIHKYQRFYETMLKDN